MGILVGIGALTLIFLRMLGWYECLYDASNNRSRANTHFRTALVFAIQSWLAETPAKRAKSPTPGYFTVLMGCKSTSGHDGSPIANKRLVMSLAVVR